MFIQRDSLLSEELELVEELYEAVANPTVLQHPKWPIGLSSTQSLQHFILKEDDKVVAYVRVIESRLSRAPWVRYALIDGTPVAHNAEHVASIIRFASSYYLSAGFAEFTVRLRSLDLQFSEHVRRLLLKEGAVFAETRSSELRSTLVLDVGEDLEALEAGFSTNLKRNIKKGLKADIEIRTVESVEAFLPFQTIFSKMEKERNVDLYSADHVLQVYEFIAATKLGAMLGAYHNGEMVGGMLLVKHGDRMEYLIGATDPDQRSLPQSHLTFIEAIRLTQKAGVRLFDFGGFGFNAVEGQQVFNINRFKLGFSKDVRFYPAPMTVQLNPFRSKVGAGLVKLSGLLGR